MLYDSAVILETIRGGISLNYLQLLMSRLVTRGFAPSLRLLSVLDGSAALKKSVLKFFPDAAIQRCLVHKERNVRAKLSKRHWGELARLFKRLREVQ